MKPVCLSVNNSKCFLWAVTLLSPLTATQWYNIIFILIILDSLHDIDLIWQAYVLMFVPSLSEEFLLGFLLGFFNLLTAVDRPQMPVYMIHQQQELPSSITDIIPADINMMGPGSETSGLDFEVGQDEVRNTRTEMGNIL